MDIITQCFNHGCHYHDTSYDGFCSASAKGEGPRPESCNDFSNSQPFCACKNWQENEPIINAPYGLHLSVVGEYSGKKFVFCPWCGERLATEQRGRT